MDITNENFEQAFDDICKALKGACLVAFDLEFTGLDPWPCEQVNTSEILDDFCQRYRRMRKTAQDNSVLQVGLCVFHCDDNCNFTARPYNFNVFPEATLETTGFSTHVDDVFACQKRSIRFLAKNHFDFNKCFMHGVPYLNGQQENMVHKALTGDSYLYDDMLDEIRAFLKGPGETTILKLHLPSDRSAFIVKAFIQEKFPGTLVEALGSSVVQIRKADFQEEREANLESVFNKVRGFRRVFMEIVKSRVPVVGHNCLLDLILTYQSFFQPLPEDVDLFLQRVHQDVFPVLWDTKYVIKTLRSTIPDIFQGIPMSLAPLYDGLAQKWTEFENLPKISIEQQYNRYLSPNSEGLAQETGLPDMISTHAAHEAGYDAWMTGVCLIRMASLIHRHSTDDVPTFNSYRNLLSPFDNCVNMMYGPNLVVNFALPSTDQVNSVPAFEYKVMGSDPDWSYLRSIIKDIDMCEVDPMKEVIRVRGEMNRAGFERIIQKLSTKGMCFKLKHKSVTDWLKPLQKASGLFLNGGLVALGVLIGVGLTVSCRRR